MAVSKINKPVQQWIDISENIIFGGIVSSHSVTAKYQPQLGLLHVYGSITTNAALSAYSATNLFQITGNYKPRMGAVAVINNNNHKAHLVQVDSEAKYQYADSQAIGGPVALYIDHLASFA